MITNTSHYRDISTKHLIKVIVQYNPGKKKTVKYPQTHAKDNSSKGTSINHLSLKPLLYKYINQLKLIP